MKVMEAIEFLTKIKADNNIKIPKKYAAITGAECRVIILLEQQPAKKNLPKNSKP